MSESGTIRAGAGGFPSSPVAMARELVVRAGTPGEAL
jgi:hypothetical protein